MEKVKVPNIREGKRRKQRCGRVQKIKKRRQKKKRAPPPLHTHIARKR